MKKQKGKKVIILCTYALICLILCTFLCRGLCFFSLKQIGLPTTVSRLSGLVEVFNRITVTLLMGSIN